MTIIDTTKVLLRVVSMSVGNLDSTTNCKGKKYIANRSAAVDAKNERIKMQTMPKLR